LTPRASTSWISPRDWTHWRLGWRHSCGSIKIKGRIKDNNLSKVVDEGTSESSRANSHHVCHNLCFVLRKSNMNFNEPCIRLCI
jgi:hypothetical protein